MARKGTPTDRIVEQRAPSVGGDVSVAVLIGARRVPFRVANLSVEGARMTGPLALLRGQRVGIVFEVESKSVEVVAEVVSVDTSDLLTDQITVRFIEVSPDAHAAIVRLMPRMTDDSAEVDDERVTGRIPRNVSDADVDAATLRVTKRKRRS